MNRLIVLLFKIILGKFLNPNCHRLHLDFTLKSYQLHPTSHAIPTKISDIFVDFLGEIIHQFRFFSKFFLPT